MSERDLTAIRAAYGLRDVPVVLDPNGGPREFTLIGVAERPCDHANGHCKDTAHKYELPVE